MSSVNTLALMREATRRVEADYLGALQVQMSAAGTPAEFPSAFNFWFDTQCMNNPAIRSVIIEYINGTWGTPQTSEQPIEGALQNDILRVEIDLNGAIGYIRDSGYSGPLFFGGLLQPLVHPIPPNPLYNFSTQVGGSHYYFVDAVTGTVSQQ